MTVYRGCAWDVANWESQRILPAGYIEKKNEIRFLIKIEHGAGHSKKILKKK